METQIKDSQENKTIRNNLIDSILIKKSHSTIIWNGFFYLIWFVDHYFMGSPLISAAKLEFRGINIPGE